LLAAGTTIAAARRVLADQFRAADLDTPELDARILIAKALALDHASLIATGDRALAPEAADAITALAVRRLAREPVARIVGRKEFWGLDLRVTPATLIPRPDTETVVEASLDLIDRGDGRQVALRIADLGTGTGALLLALLSELPHATGIGTDISVDALAVARDNAVHHGLGTRATFVVCSFGAALRGGFDLVVSNPPYVASNDIAALAPEAASEPRVALDGGADGLDCYRAIVADAGRLLDEAGHLVVELGLGQDHMVTALMRAQGLGPRPARPDLAGIPRALAARVSRRGYDN
jgi:release factor glutamine methyltransferase